MATATEVFDRPAGAAAEARWTPSARGWAARLGVLAAVFGGVIWITGIVPGYWASRISYAAIFAIIGLSLNVVLGYVGQVSLGHHGFVGIAAFVAAYYVTEKAGCTLGDCPFGSFTTAMVIAAASGALAAGVLGLVALRIRGLYLALITLAYGFVAETSIFEIPALTGGGAGMPAPRPDGFTSHQAFAYLTFAFLAGALYLDWRLIRSKVGRAVLSLKHSEPVAASYGINVTAYKTLAFVFSGFLAGIAGALFAFRNENVVANDFVFANALLWVLMVVVGGLGNRTGVVIGSAFFALFPFLFEISPTVERFFLETLGRAPAFFTIIVGSALALLTIILYPGGIAEQISPITRWLRGERFALHPAGHAKPPGPPDASKHKKRLARFGRKRAGATDPEGAARPPEAPELVGTPAESPELTGAAPGPDGEATAEQTAARRDR